MIHPQIRNCGTGRKTERDCLPATPDQWCQFYNQVRGSHGYNLTNWRGLRASVLGENSLCLFCKLVCKIAPATVVDHIVDIAERQRGPAIRFGLGGGLPHRASPRHAEERVKLALNRSSAAILLHFIEPRKVASSA